VNESTAQANGQAPVEQLVAVEDMLRPMVAHEVARQLAVPPRKPSVLERIYHALWIGSMVSLVILTVLTASGLLR
jgi:hypothetical protein